MCGIAGFVGHKNIYTTLIEGLEKLEYRGYDSAGIAVIPTSKASGFLQSYKTVGRISNLKKFLDQHTLLDANVGIAHTRWATHGTVCEVNTHPHLNDDKTIAIVHNGIVENMFQLKQDLEKKGYNFLTDTDSEIVTHLISHYYSMHKDLVQAIRKMSEKIQGMFSLAVISYHHPGQIFAMKKNMSLVVGWNSQEYYLASDPVAIPSHITQIAEVQDLEIVHLSMDGCSVFDDNGKSAPLIIQSHLHTTDHFSKEGFEHFMLKEIYQQPSVIEKILKEYVCGDTIQFPCMSISNSTWHDIQYVVIVACGTAYHAGLVARYVLEALTNILVSVEMSSEFRYSNPILMTNTLVIFISQSGETADTLAAFRSTKKQQATTLLSIVNINRSSLAKESKHVIYTHAGLEVAVASTKAYTAQVMVLYLLAIYIAQQLKKNQFLAKLIFDDLQNISKHYGTLLEQRETIQHIVKIHAQTKNFLFLGRHVQYPVALEGALKLKEVSYIFAEGYAAGEMKHGHIALIDKYCAIVCLVPQSMIYSKMMSNISEMHVREGRIIAVATDGDQEILKYTKHVIYLPSRVHEFVTPLLVAVPLQLLAYEVGRLTGCNIDHPRNLAKSVTVE